MEPENQQPAQTPAEPATPAAPVQPADNQTPAAPAEPAVPANGEDQTPDGQGDGQQPPQQTRQERRDQERQQRQSAVAQLNQQQPQQPQVPNQPWGAQQSPQMPQYQPGQEVSPEQLQQDVVQTASAIAGLQVQQQLQQHDAKRNLDADITSLPKSFDELNPDNDLYTPELDQAIAQEFQERAFRVVGYQPNGQPIRQLADPSIRLSDIAQRHVASARALAQRMSASGQAATAALADTAAPRPAGQGPAEKPFASLSREEMRKRVGYAKQG
jgi:hypothetical protein